MLSGNAYSIPCISSRFKLINRVWLLYRDKKTVTIMTKKTTKKKKKKIELCLVVMYNIK
jgi:hypothetical protein